MRDCRDLMSSQRKSFWCGPSSPRATSYVQNLDIVLQPRRVASPTRHHFSLFSWSVAWGVLAWDDVPLPQQEIALLWNRIRATFLHRKQQAEHELDDDSWKGSRVQGLDRRLLLWSRQLLGFSVTVSFVRCKNKPTSVKSALLKNIQTHKENTPCRKKFLSSTLLIAALWECTISLLKHGSESSFHNSFPVSWPEPVGSSSGGAVWTSKLITSSAHSRTRVCFRVLRFGGGRLRIYFT